VAKSSIWYILRKKNALVGSIKRDRFSERRKVVDDFHIISMVKKNPSQHVAR